MFLCAFVNTNTLIAPEVDHKTLVYELYQRQRFQTRRRDPPFEWMLTSGTFDFPLQSNSFRSLC